MPRSKEMVVYIGEGEVLAGPLSSERDLLEYFFLCSDREVRNFDRKVFPCDGIDELISKSKGLLGEEVVL